jgi:hypothetical protein
MWMITAERLRDRITDILSGNEITPSVRKKLEYFNSELQKAIDGEEYGRMHEIAAELEAYLQKRSMTLKNPQPGSGVPKEEGLPKEEGVPTQPPHGPLDPDEPQE